MNGKTAMAAAVAVMGTMAAAQGADRIWGLHFDFHASPSKDGKEVAIGSTLKESDVAEICDLIRPDFLQIDCKGHPGWTSYPSKLGNAMPKFDGDPLRLWRKVTAAKGVPLYMHYSGIYDARYCANHPEEAVMGADGKRTTSAKPDGRYADDLLIPQLCELAGEYGVDGVWVDGDCWAVACDYDPKAVSAFEKTTGIDLRGKAPKSNDDPYFDEFREYFRGLYRKYLNHYVDAVHAKYPKFRVCSNWSYSLSRPDDIDAGVDFVSGDLASTDSYYSSRLAGRLNARHRLPWDLMSWEFRYDWQKNSAYVTKHPVQLMQEAASVISLGGGFQVYIQQKRDGSPDMERVRAMKPVGDFVRARAPYCFGGRAKRELAVLLPVSSQYRQNDRPFATSGQHCARGLLNLLCDAGYSTCVATESDLAPERIRDWKVIVVPQLFCALPKATMDSIAAWTKAGGRLVVAGIETCRFFAEAGFPTALADDLVENQRLFTLDGVRSGSLQWSRTLRDDAGEVIARTQVGNRPFAAIRPFGEGRVAVVGSDVGYSYENAGQYLQRELVSTMVDRLHAVSARVEGALGLVELTQLEKDGRTFVQLVNANGPHHNAKVFSEDFIPPALDVRVALRLPARPKELILRPSGARLAFDWKDGVARVTVPRVDLHEIIEVRRADAKESAMVMLRFSSAQTQSMEEWRQTAKAFAANRGCCDDVWFSTGESFPGLDWHRRNVEVVRVAAEDLRKLGIRVSLQFEATIGHGDNFPTAEEKARFDKPWTGWTGPDGTECKYCSCPRQDGFLKRLVEVSELYAVIRPAIVWIDDDLRLENHWPVTGRDGPGCWCDKCVADFSKQEGRTWTRAELHTAWKRDKALQDRWGDFSAGSMAEVARVIACAFRKVSPKTRLGLQTSENRKRLVGTVVRKLREATGEKTAVRLGGGDYYDLSPYVQLRKSRQMVRARKELDLEDLVDNWCTEVETYPRAYGSRSVRSIALEAFSSVAWGFDTTSLFVMDRRSETDELYSCYLLKPLVAVTKFLNDYRAANAGTVPAGFTCPDADPERILMGLPILPGLGKSWGTISGEQEDSLGWSPVWGKFRNDLMTDFRRTPSAKLQSIRDRVSGNAPLKLLSPFVGLVLPRVAADGALRTVGLIGTRLDPQEEIAIQLQTTAEKAVWRELGAEPIELRVRAAGDRRMVTVPSIGAWGMGYLEVW